MYVTPIRLDVLLNTNQISCCKGKWYVRKIRPYLRRKYPYIGFTSTFFAGEAEDSVGGFDITSNWIINQRNSVWDITASMR